MNFLNIISDFLNPEHFIWNLAGVICFLFALPVHECAHGYVAYKLGDPTAKNMGRLTLNPLKHMDVLGAISIVLFGVGWAKPVQINPYNFRNPKQGMAISSAAGPISNFILAFVFMVLYKFTYFLPETGFAYFVSELLFGICYINLSLMIFNLIPVPPFDGSRIANYFMPEHIYFKIMDYENFIMIGMLALFASGVLDRPLEIVTGFMVGVLDKLTFPIDFVWGLLY